MGTRAGEFLAVMTWFLRILAMMCGARREVHLCNLERVAPKGLTSMLGGSSHACKACFFRVFRNEQGDSILGPYDHPRVL